MENMEPVPDRHHRGARRPAPGLPLAAPGLPRPAPCLPRPASGLPRPAPCLPRPAPGLPRPAPGLPLAALAGLLVLACLALCSCGGSSAPTYSFNGTGYPNGNLSNTRFSGGPINQSTVKKLGVAWHMPLAAKSLYGAYASSPVIANGVIYSQDLESNVQAIDLQTGKVLWTKNYESPDQGPNGLVVGGGRVYGATATSAFALNEKTGAQLWSVELVRNSHEGIDMAPGYHNGIVYIATVPGNNAKFYGGGGDGILWALEGASGRKLWHFDTSPEDLWSPEHTSLNAGGGVWYAPAFDEQGSIYFGTGNPAPFPGTAQYPWGSSRPGPDLYNDSLLKLNATTGKLEWYYQAFPHDLYDRDLEAPPILMSIDGKQAVVTAGKGGFVYALERETGKLLWKRSVGKHNGHDNDGLYAMKHEYSKLHMPETVEPGLLGGVIAPMATNGSILFVPVVNLPVHYTSQTEDTEGPESSGELVALNASTGAVLWVQKLSTPAFGAATAVNNLVFATIGGGTLYAFSDTTGEVVWQVQLPAGSNTGVAVSGDTVVVPAGLTSREGETPELVAYRLGASGGGEAG
jgi:outer membrane protein assembly factor BamB